MQKPQGPFGEWNFTTIPKAIMGEVLTEHFLTIFVHTFWEIGGVLFWQGDIFSSQLGSF